MSKNQTPNYRIFLDISIMKGIGNYTRDMLEPDDRTEEEKLADCEKECEEFNAEEGMYDPYYRCPICKGKQEYAHPDRYEGGIVEYYPKTEKCGCIGISKELRRLANLSISSAIGRNTLENFIVKDEWQEIIKSSAERFITDEKARLLYVSGQPGCGKTHLCTGVFTHYLRKNANARFMSWVEIVSRLKRLYTNDDVYRSLIGPYKDAKIVYIDDFLKPVKSNAGVITLPDEREMKIAYEIINHRYNMPGFRTIISTEIQLPMLIQADEAIGSRIYELAGDYVVAVSKGEGRNERLGRRA